MDKKKIFYAYSDFTNLQNIGLGWISQVTKYIPITYFVTEVAMYKIFTSQWNIPMMFIVIFVMLKYYAYQIGGWLIGRFAIKIGIYNAQNQYGAKKEHLNPFNCELIEQLTEIGNKLGVKSKFSKL